MSFHSRWSIVRNTILDMLFPPHCVVCGHDGEWLCPDCVASFHYVQSPVCAVCGRPLSRGNLCHSCSRHPMDIDGIRAATYFEGRVRQCIHHFKYKGTRVLAPYLGEVMAQAWQRAPFPASTIVPVPLHPQRMRQRGYNQSALLARELGQRINMPIIDDCLLRVKHTRPQVGLGAAERRMNVQGAFRCTDQRLEGKSIMLIDDVCTTGATLEACAHALYEQGSHVVWALVLAREHHDH